MNRSGRHGTTAFLVAMGALSLFDAVGALGAQRGSLPTVLALALVVLAAVGLMGHLSEVAEPSTVIFITAFMTALLMCRADLAGSAGWTQVLGCLSAILFLSALQQRAVERSK